MGNEMWLISIIDTGKIHKYGTSGTRARNTSQFLMKVLVRVKSTHAFALLDYSGYLQTRVADRLADDLSLVGLSGLDI